MANTLEDMCNEFAELQIIRHGLDENANLNTPRQKLAEKEGYLENTFYNTPAPYLYDILDKKQNKSKEDLVKHVNENMDAILEELKNETLLQCLMSMSPIKTGNEEHDKIAEAHEKFLEVQAYKSNPDKMAQFIVGEKAKKEPYLADIYGGIAIADPHFREIAFKSREIFYTAEFYKVLGVNKDNLDRDKILRYIKGTYNLSKEKDKGQMAVGIAMNLYSQKAKNK